MDWLILGSKWAVVSVLSLVAVYAVARMACCGVLRSWDAWKRKNGRN